MERNRRNSREEEESSTNWGLWGGIGVGVAAAAGALYYIATRNRETVLEQQPDQRRRLEAIDFSQHQQQVPMIRYESGLQLQGDLPGNQGINNLNSLLNDIYVRYTGVKKDDFQLHYSVFYRIFNRLHQKMKDVDKYYNRYSSTVQITGSHSDKLRIKKPDEFDMDIVIKLPLSIKQNPYNVNDSDFIIEPKDAGFVYLKMGVQYDKLPMRDGGSNWDINKTAYKWSDDYGYLLRSKFTDWFKGVVVKALNQFEKNENGYTVYEVDGVEYSIGRSESGPAVTLHIFNRLRKFKMDVDLVPALKFPEERWPPGPDYRDIPYNCRKAYWMVVPKPNKRSQ
ncbi:unnamed protein product [Chilo suppressalis]|uniref:Mab-21-like nucleotidyltransferase domain-containing protein n=1 Tax=Chilo suppressalis TaxID=168631 RepID=A0ABN8L8W1_CHISP|nr:unnamed protein product [Chilo suppressalis]